MTSLVCHKPALVSAVGRTFHEVWASNFEEEFNCLLAAVASAGGPEVTLALDMEFPGFPSESPRFSSPEAHYEALRRNVDQLWPIQLGVAVLGANGVHRGVWTFNLHFDASVDAHTEESLAFLRAAGINFPRHRAEGIKALALGQHLASSSLIGAHGRAPCWLTFSGSYDWGYLVKLVTLGRALPGLASTFDNVLSIYCPRRQELRDLLPSGSLEVLGRKHGVKRWGTAHTAGSDALLTLELFMLLGGPKLQPGNARKLEETQQQDDVARWGEMIWQNVEVWYPSDTEQWYLPNNCSLNGGVTQLAHADWENSSWVTQSQTSNDSLWYPTDFQPWVAAW